MLLTKCVLTKKKDKDKFYFLKQFFPKVMAFFFKFRVQFYES